ncbi:hypothetical protein RRG08_039956 [Elysia crispata]|uniref:C-type lectin domain-containing protein n=1 Tax=Elysia crispata TaxID=231223 RepID=A0AAE0Z7X4_9GAST|nr:hypothetical protein RRG08_039956 [Elysia crispata]
MHPGKCILAFLGLVLTTVLGSHANTCLTAQQGNTSVPHCPAGWELTRLSRFCLKLSYVRRNWSEARLACQSEGADLTRTYYDSMLLSLDTFRHGNSVLWDGFWISLTLSRTSQKWTWPGETVQPSFLPWAPSNPKFYDHCAQANSAYYYWLGSDCSSRVYFSCEIAKPGSGCPDGWNELEPLNWCIKDSPTLGDYNFAQTWCSALNASLITLKDRTKRDAFVAYRSTINRAWIGITDQEREGHFVWATGGEARYLSQNLREDGYNRENCVHIGKNFRTWFDEDCSVKLPYICQKPSHDGLGAPVMEVESRFTESTKGHRPIVLHTYFVGDEVKATCKALRVPGGELFWTLLGKGRSSLRLALGTKILSTNYVETIQQGTTCVNQTVSIFTVTASKNMTHGYLNCFSVDDKSAKQCIGFGNALEYCDKSHQFKVLGGPDKPPAMDVKYSHPPAIFFEGDMVDAVCTVYPGEGGSLVWVIYSPGGNRSLENHFDPEIVAEKSDILQGKVFTKSRLEFTAKKSFDGGRIACFAYDVTKTSSLECRPSDKYCVITPAVRVDEKTYLGAYWFSFPRPGFFLGVTFLCVLTLCLFTLLRTFTDSGIPEGYGEGWADLDGNQWHDPWTYETGHEDYMAGVVENGEIENNGAGFAEVPVANAKLRQKAQALRTVVPCPGGAPAREKGTGFQACGTLPGEVPTPGKRHKPPVLWSPARGVAPPRAKGTSPQARGP